MCIVCSGEYNIYTEWISCCMKVKHLPNISFNNLETLRCYTTHVTEFPSVFYEDQKVIRNLRELSIANTKIKIIPYTLINLKILTSKSSSLLYLPETIKKLNHFWFDNDLLISPECYISKINNDKYLTFVRCQKRIKLKHKIKSKLFTIVYYPQYIIGALNCKSISKHLTI